LASAAAAAAGVKTDQALQRYRQLFLEDDSGSWDPVLLLPQLQALLEGPGGVFRAVLGWQPAAAGIQPPTAALGPGMGSCGSQQLQEGLGVHGGSGQLEDDSEEACEGDQGVGAGEGSVVDEGAADGELAFDDNDATPGVDA
jgi:hypothetical protein